LLAEGGTAEAEFRASMAVSEMIYECKILANKELRPKGGER